MKRIFIFFWWEICIRGIIVLFCHDKELLDFLMSLPDLELWLAPRFLGFAPSSFCPKILSIAQEGVLSLLWSVVGHTNFSGDGYEMNRRNFLPFMGFES